VAECKDHRIYGTVAMSREALDLSGILRGLSQDFTDHRYIRPRQTIIETERRVEIEVDLSRSCGCCKTKSICLKCMLSRLFADMEEAGNGWTLESVGGTVVLDSYKPTSRYGSIPDPQS
jgi:hypothetical protein